MNLAFPPDVGMEADQGKGEWDESRRDESRGRKRAQNINEEPAVCPANLEWEQQTKEQEERMRIH